MLVYGCVSPHVSKPSSLPRISHGADARKAKVLSRTQPLRSTNSETTFIVQTFAKYGLYQLFMLFKRALTNGFKLEMSLLKDKNFQPESIFSGSN